MTYIYLADSYGVYVYSDDYILDDEQYDGSGAAP